MALGNQEFFCGNYGAGLAQRGDFQELIRRTGLPLETAKRVKNISIHRAAQLSSEKVQPAFQRLLNLNVDVVVCEAAAGWLPIWPDCPVVNHVFYLERGSIRFFPNVNLQFDYRLDDPIRKVDELTQILDERRSPWVELPLYMVQEKHREKVLFDITQKLLEHAQQKQSAGA